MLKRVYIDNFRSFVNFELPLAQQQLILGLNGTGKSTLLEVLQAIKGLISGEQNPDIFFPATTLTRWQTLSKQTFELDVELGSLYQFRLELDSWGSPPRTRIKRESVMCDKRLVFEFVDGEVHLFNDFFEQKVTYPFDWFRSALATIQPRAENTKLIHFKNWIANLYCLQINPGKMSERAEREEPELALDTSNFASWYRHMTQEQAGAAARLQEHLRRIIPGFESLDLRAAGTKAREIMVRFAHTQGLSPMSFDVGFSELSDGQRVLICLYSLLEFIVTRNACIFLDEPENYIAIPEIQPWLMELRDRVDDLGAQVTLISHHPEIVNYMAPELGIVFEREGPGPVRVHKYVSSDLLAPAEQIARGW